MSEKFNPEGLDSRTLAMSVQAGHSFQDIAEFTGKTAAATQKAMDNVIPFPTPVIDPSQKPAANNNDGHRGEVHQLPRNKRDQAFAYQQLQAQWAQSAENR